MCIWIIGIPDKVVTDAVAIASRAGSRDS